MFNFLRRVRPQACLVVVDYPGDSEPTGHVFASYKEAERFWEALPDEFKLGGFAAPPKVSQPVLAPTQPRLLGQVDEVTVMVRRGVRL